MIQGGIMINAFFKYLKGLGAFSAGILFGVIYGSIVSTITCVAILGLP
jgi:hypothetical protein